MTLSEALREEQRTWNKSTLVKRAAARARGKRRRKEYGGAQHSLHEREGAKSAGERSTLYRKEKAQRVRGSAALFTP